MAKLAQILILTTCVWLTSRAAADQSDILDEPFHLGWTSNNTQLDFIFSLNGPITKSINSDTIPDDLSPAWAKCVDNNACLIKDRKQVITYTNTTQSSNEDRRILTYTPTPNQALFSITKSKQECVQTEVKINTYCNTHWNPPMLAYSNECNMLIEWHSPYACNKNHTSYERPCYIHYGGKLIDLTPWVLSNGSSYIVDNNGHNDVKDLHLNVCNEASRDCGPNVASCFVGSSGTVESGYNNMTSIDYNESNKSVSLIQIGQKDTACSGGRFKTTVEFKCRSGASKTKSRPTLVRGSKCENHIEWPTMHACPVPDIKLSASDCRFKSDLMGVDINLRKIFNTSTFVEVDNIEENGVMKTIKLGLCRGIDRLTFKCEGKDSSTTTACLVEPRTKLSSEKAVQNSTIVGHMMNSAIRLVDDRLYLESFVTNRTCQERASHNFNTTYKVGTRIEFFNSPVAMTKPKYLGRINCVYTFEWGSPEIVFESLESSQSADVHDAKNSSTTASTVDKSGKDIAPKPKSTVHKESDEPKSEKQVTSTSTAAPNTVRSSTVEPKSPEPISTGGSITGARMNNLHKFYMIVLIIGSMSLFIAVIFILDRKTRSGFPVRCSRLRQMFQPPPVPYSRVHDCSRNFELDL